MEVASAAATQLEKSLWEKMGSSDDFLLTSIVCCCRDLMGSDITNKNLEESKVDIFMEDIRNMCLENKSGEDVNRSRKK